MPLPTDHVLFRAIYKIHKHAVLLAHRLSRYLSSSYTYKQHVVSKCYTNTFMQRYYYRFVRITYLPTCTQLQPVLPLWLFH